MSAAKAIKAKNHLKSRIRKKINYHVHNGIDAPSFYFSINKILVAREEI